MAIALRPAQTEFTYVLEGDRDLPVEEQTIWTLRVPKMHQRQSWEKLLAPFKVEEKQMQAQITQLKYAREVLRESVVKVENLKDPDGKEVTFEAEKGKCPDSFLERIVPMMPELVDVILDGDSVTVDEAKN